MEESAGLERERHKPGRDERSKFENDRCPLGEHGMSHQVVLSVGHLVGELDGSGGGLGPSWARPSEYVLGEEFWVSTDGLTLVSDWGLSCLL